MSRPIRILHVTSSLNYGGLERLIVDICLSMDKSRFQPFVACLKYKGDLAPEVEAAGVPVTALNEEVAQSRKYSSFGRLERLIRSQGIDVVHTHNTGPLVDTLFARLRRFAPIHVVHTDHTRPTWPDKRKYMLLEWLASYWVSAMVAVSDAAKADLVHYEKIAEQRISVIDNGINVNRFDEPSIPTEQWRRETGLAEFDHVVGVLAMHRRQKGITHFLKAIPGILRQFPRAGFVIGGGGPLQQEHEAEAKALGIEGHVRFIGRRNDVVDVLHAMDVYVLPSESEGLPIGLLEAMAASRCILATSVGAVPKVLADGQAGILVPPKEPEAITNAVCELLRDDERRKALGHEARARVEEAFSIQSTVSAYERLYEQAVQRSARKGA
ncbi:glycosyltransferase [Aquisalimonas lutea]|uniref:glycosyltransferase n=1 Tax=Aquisalimonas lutea TaxID=1327750 RepID=UPI0025B3ACD0|nr:glycosyltransferase [Aquisalimonas lutea]MDN3517182.1 glycosyltransferase [Aquisalimonas lutea]